MGRGALAPQIRTSRRNALALLGGVAIGLVMMLAQPPAAEASGMRSENATTNRMIEGAPHAGPLGWRAMCRRDPALCETPGAPRPGAVGVLGAGGLDQIRAFNRRINSALTPAEDLTAFGALDLWRLPSPGDFADCEDYVLAKRAQLLAAGWPPESVLIAVVEGIVTPYHAVLVLRTDQGEFVLDNLTDEVVDWRDSGYVWVVRQSAADPGVWVRVVG